jgi:membrane-associated protease RseP (regulator of RpoE activity)
VTPEGPASGPQFDVPEGELRLDLAYQFVAAQFPGAIPQEGIPPAFVLPGVHEVRDRFLALQRDLAPLGLLPFLRMQDGRPVLRLLPRPAPGEWRWQVNLILLLATVVTTFLAGYMLAGGLVSEGYLQNAVTDGIWYSASVLFILGAHEMGHKIASMLRGIDASLPYFIPMVPLPPLPGTLGAVIITRTPAPNRDSLMDLGASGPIAGFVAAIPVLIYGVSHSVVVKASDIAHMGSVPDPLLIQWMVKIIFNPPPDAAVIGHPLLFAGWIGLLVTGLNLLPAGMLDGGHAVRAALGARAHVMLSYVGLGLAVLLGYYPMAIIIALLIRRGHVGPLDDITPLSPSRRLVGLVLVAIFIVSAVVLQPLFAL